MAKIKINNAQYSCIIGINDEERLIKRDIFIDLEIEYDITKSVHTDDLNYTINYSEVNKLIKELIENKVYNLIETMAEDILKLITSKFNVASVKINLSKPTGIKNADSSGIEIYREKNKVFIALGTNLGDKKENINKAIELIQKKSTLLSKSSLLYNPPAFYEDQDEFINAVICIETYLSPRELINYLLYLEKHVFKRIRIVKNEPRTIDLDIIFFGSKLINEEGLHVPHPHMHERDFVLKPMTEIAPEYVHPRLGVCMGDLYKKLALVKDVQ